MSGSGIRQVEAIARSEMFPSVDKALRELGVSGVTMVEGKGRGRDKITTTSYEEAGGRGPPMSSTV